MAEETPKNENEVVEETTEETPVETATEETAAEAPVTEEATEEETSEPVAEAEEAATTEASSEEADDETEETEEAPAAEAEEAVTAEASSEEAADDAEETEEAPVADGPGSIEELKVGMELTGKVKSLELYGAFVDIGIGKDALLHISQLGKQNVRNVEDIVKKGETVKVYVIKVDPGSGRIALSLERPPENPINDLKVGDVVTGRVVRIENFGAFVDFGAERPGMIHVSELATEYINSPEDKVSLNDEVRVKVIKVNKKRRQIDLSIKALEEAEQRRVIEESSITESDEPMPTAMELALRRAMDDSDDDDEANANNADKKNRNSKKKKKALNDALQRMLDSDS